MSDIFNNVSELDEATPESQELEKALNAGYGTDAATFEGGRALQVEDLEATLISVLDVNQNECKLFNKVHKQPMTSTVHQILRRTSVGDDDFNFVSEGELAKEDSQTLERKIFESKYLSTKYQVSHQLTLTNQATNALASEKTAAVVRIARSAEKAFFHGDSSVNPKAFDGLLKVIKDSASNTDVAEKNRATVIDAGGKQIGEDGLGYDFFNEVAEKVMGKGGDLNEAYFPLPVAQQFYKLWNDKLRFIVGEKNAMANLERLPNLPTATGSIIKIQENGTGIDKQFKVKGKVVAAGDRKRRPNAPTTVAVSANASASDSAYTEAYAGDYVYEVFAVNSYGISGGTKAAAPVAVAVGGSVTVTITPDTNGEEATGYIICRSKAGGTETMEMCRIRATRDDNTVFTDLNNDLPGTTEIILLSSKTQELMDNLSFAQLMPISSFELPRDSSWAHRGTVALYGTPELRAPELCAVVKNLGYAGGLY